MKPKFQICLLAVLPLLLAGCLPIKPGNNRTCGYPGLKRFSRMCKEGLTCFSDRVCRPPLPLGSACGKSEECAGDAKCDCGDGDCYPELGTCVARATAGATCASWDDCAFATFCPSTPGPRVCTTRFGNGDACGEDQECRADLHCTLGHCEARYPDGWPCARDRECLSGSFCIEHKCEAR